MHRGVENMKKTRMIAILVCILIFLCACGVSQDRAELFVDDLLSSQPRNQLEKEYKKLSQSEELQSALIQRLESLGKENRFEDCCYLIKRLEGFGYKNEEVKKQFMLCLEIEKDRVFEATDGTALADYLCLIRSYDSSFYYTILDCFPFDRMTDAIKAQCIPVITEVGRGGYYDSHDGEVEDESYWWSPLFEERARSGEVGYQKITKENLFSGDFDVVIRSEVFYGTSPSDYGNSLNASLYYKGKIVMNNYLQIRDFLALCGAENTFYCENSAHEYTFFILGEDKITVLQDKMFDIVYQ